MYNLTDYNSKQLRIFSGIIGKEIDLTKRCIEKAEEYIPAGDTLNDVTRKDIEILTELREFHVHLLTALAEVKHSEMVSSN